MNDFLKSRAGAVLLAFLAISGFLLAYEHRMHIFAGTGSGVLIALLAVCVGMHGGHGHGGGHGGKDLSGKKDGDGKEK